MEEALFSLGAILGLYIEDLRQLRDRIEGVSGVGSGQNNGKKGISLCKEDFLVYCSYSETGITTVLKFIARI
jgi:hypothetical protein